MLKARKIKPFLWFDTQAGSPRPAGMVRTVEFELEGQPFVAEEIDFYWPASLDDVFAGTDASKAERVMQAMLNMVKLDLRALEQAAQGSA